MNTIQAYWEDFETIIPPTASNIQRREMRRAFYAGAQSILQIQWTLGSEEFSEEAALQMLEGIHDECELFAKQVKLGQA